MLWAVIEADAPRVACPEHGIVVAAVPWARHDAGHTRVFDDTVAWLATRRAIGCVDQSRPHYRSGRLRHPNPVRVSSPHVTGPASAASPDTGRRQTTLMVLWASSGHGRLGSKVIWMALATKNPPMVCAAISGGVPGATRLTSWAKT